MIILHLLKKNKRVAISSNGHKAINKLIREVVEKNAEYKLGVDLKTAKVTSKFSRNDEDSDWFKKNDVDELSSIHEVIADFAHYNLVGATTFSLCNPELNGSFTHLIVDEATQVSLPNLLAMGSCAENIVLVGDQAQLEQPIQGKHPGFSGKSGLAYLSGDEVTINPSLGILLRVTRRMHPDVCRFVSESFYNGELTHHPMTEKRALHFPKGGLKHVTKSTGILYLEARHAAARVAESEEEVQKIVKINEEILRCDFQEADGTRRRMTQGDILFVAPYNLQVENLKKALPEGALVGSVDLFQGQEKPVVVLSMCASDGESAPRGISFVLDPHRLNVALSRSQVLSIVVGSPKLASTSARTLDNMKELNTYCKIMLGGDFIKKGVKS